jgi:hypothetical protein
MDPYLVHFWTGTESSIVGGRILDPPSLIVQHQQQCLKLFIGVPFPIPIATDHAATLGRRQAWLITLVPHCGCLPSETHVEN